MTGTPLEARVDAVDRAPAGVVVQSGVEALKDALAGNATAFAEWRREPMTRHVLRALQSYLVHPPEADSAGGALVQYGVTQGILLAYQLVSDPSALWPGVFDGERKQPELGRLPEMDFETSLDEALK